MQCPVDQAVLQMSDRQGIEIDYCPTCRGVWLDRGELDKIIDRSASSSPTQPQYEERRERSEYREQPRHHDDEYKHKKKHKKESFLGDIFDF